MKKNASCFLLIVTLLPGLLTKKFINLLEGAEDGTLDLNKAAETLEVWFSIIIKKMLSTLVRHSIFLIV